MKFLCCCYYDLDKFSKFTESDLSEMKKICTQHDDKLRESGHLQVIGSLSDPSQYKTIRARNGEVTNEDGPYAPTKEPFGAFFIIDADDMEQAISVAALHPSVHISQLCNGGIEIRPIDNYMHG